MQTREVNQALKNNSRKFPSGYTFVLDDNEMADLRSKILTTNLEGLTIRELNRFLLRFVIIRRLLQKEVCI